MKDNTSTQIDYGYWVSKYYEYNIEKLREDGLTDIIPDDDPNPMIEQALSYHSEDDIREIFNEKLSWIVEDDEFKSMYPKFNKTKE